MLGPRKVILASNSPRRKELLQRLGYLFNVIPSDFDEKIIKHGNPAEFVRLCALGKAFDVSLKRQEGIVLGADTIVVLNGKIFGKPKNAADARRMLKKLSGKTHSVFTGVALINAKTKERNSFSEESVVKFKELSKKDIDNYLACKEWFGKAGAYAIQGEKAKDIIEGYDGSFSNIVGLPTESLAPLLREFFEKAY